MLNLSKMQEGEKSINGKCYVSSCLQCNPYFLFLYMKRSGFIAIIIYKFTMGEDQNQQNHEENGVKEAPHVAVVMVPFPAQGHLNQLLQLSRIISSYNIPVHYVGSATHINQAKLRLQGWDPLLEPNFHFHDFPTPHFHSPPPDPDASVQFPAHLQPCFEASSELREPVAALLRELSLTVDRLIVINDSLMGSVVQDFVGIGNAESYTFHSVSVFSIFFFFWESLGRPALEGVKIPEDVPSLDGCFTLEFFKFLVFQHEFKKLSSGNLYYTSKLIEGPYVDILREEEIDGVKKKGWALGPLNLVTTYSDKTSNHGDKCLEWLDKQAPKSVLLVSFGTSTSLTDEQIKELAIGLERSGHKFIWLLRDADKGDIFSEEVRRSELPEGYEERMKETGMGVVVREWAPQLEILGHSSTGGLMCHCGWNSCLESISMGVPIAAWPMHSDQPRNAALVTQVLQVGLAVKEWAEREQLVAASAIEKAVRRLMASEEGNAMRKKAQQLGNSLQRSMEEGGVSRKELDGFIAHITRQLGF